MKKILDRSKLLLAALLLLQLNVLAQDDEDKGNDKKYEFARSKAVNKSYNVSSSDKLKIENSFGRVDIHTWDRNEIKVDVSIEVSASTNDLAQRIIDGITVSDSQSGKEISFKTSIKGNNNSGKNEKSTMKVNYNISMPAGNPLNVENSFGATTIPDYRGEVSLVSKFGSLTAGDLANVKRLDVEFGRAKIESVNNGSLSIKYSNSTLGKISGDVRMNLEFSTMVKMNLDNSLTGLDIKASYSTVNLKPDGGLGASYNISTSFGSLKNRTSIKFDGDDVDDDRGPKFDHKYSGRSGSGSVPIKVSTSFGSVILGEPGPDDLKDKEKNKNRNKNKAI
jgi:hypothetical protein